MNLIRRPFKFKHIYFHFIILLILSTCKNSPTETITNHQRDTIIKKEKPMVSVIDLKTGIFYKEILSNGKLYALLKADLKFRVSEQIEKIYVKNGDVVQKNDVLAKVNSFEYFNRLQSAQNQYEKALTEMQDILIGQGLNINDSASISNSVWKIAASKSGLADAIINLRTANYNYTNTALKAPFRGVIANLRCKENNMSGSDAFCTLIDNSAFDAEFQVLESELANVAVGQTILATPFAIDSSTLPGVISEINPFIDENGLVTIKARVNNFHNNLYEGMNIRVIIRKAFPNKLVVPKQAVLQRQGKEVVFTIKDGLAIWNYVKTGSENTTSYTIEEGLKPGMKVIVTGNLNLGHEAEVEVVKNEE